MDTTTGETASIHYGREVHEGLVGKLIRIDYSFVIPHLLRPQPHAQHPVPQPSPQHPITPTDPKRPYGGLVPSQPKGTRAFQDAASYNQHLAQHQAYTAQATAQANTFVNRNPYINQPAGNGQPPFPNNQDKTGTGYSQFVPRRSPFWVVFLT